MRPTVLVLSALFASTAACAAPTESSSSSASALGGMPTLPAGTLGYHGQVTGDCTTSLEYMGAQPASGACTVTCDLSGEAPDHLAVSCSATLPLDVPEGTEGRTRASAGFGGWSNVDATGAFAIGDAWSGEAGVGYRGRLQGTLTTEAGGGPAIALESVEYEKDDYTSPPSVYWRSTTALHEAGLLALTGGSKGGAPLPKTWFLGDVTSGPGVCSSDSGVAITVEHVAPNVAATLSIALVTGVARDASGAIVSSTTTASSQHVQMRFEIDGTWPGVAWSNASGYSTVHTTADTFVPFAFDSGNGYGVPLWASDFMDQFLASNPACRAQPMP